MNSKQRLKARIVGGGIIAAALVLCFNLFSISISNGDKYSTKAKNQYSKPIATQYSRGTIYFTSKNGTETAAASVKSGYLLYLNPKVMDDANGVYEALSHYVSIDKKVFQIKANKKDDPYEELLTHLDEKTAMSIQQLSLKGVGITPESWRQYPGNSLASHTLGIVGESGTSTEVSGKYGLERFYDRVLHREGEGSSVNIFAQLFSGFTAIFYDDPDSGDLVTTIEPTVETYLEKIMSDTYKLWTPDEIGGIIMEPNTGEIVAIAAHPTFNANDLKSISNAKILTNPMSEHVYEMGSIMKPITMAIALDSGAVKTDSTYDDVGCMELNEKKICNYDQKARGVTPMQQILSQSLNIGAATIALRTGASDFVRYFQNIGITKKTGIDLPNEAMPIVDNLRNPEDIDIATASYGQGIAVSPVGMVRALATVANGGYVITPHVVEKINRLNGSTKYLDYKKGSPVFKAQSVEEVKRMLVEVVDKSLANGALKKENYSIAAKTGTAAIADHKNGGYYTDRWLHSFFGFFPAYNPKYIVFLYQINPKNAKYASETLTKPFDEIADFLINYYDIPPDR